MLRFSISIPNVTVFSPVYYDDLRADLKKALYECSGVVIVRYPRGRQLFRPHEYLTGQSLYHWGKEGNPADVVDVVLVTYGRLFSFTRKACELLLERGVSASVLRLDPILPISEETVKVDFLCKECVLF